VDLAVEFGPRVASVAPDQRLSFGVAAEAIVQQRSSGLGLSRCPSRRLPTNQPQLVEWQR
ncbi:MAG: hypothetical protein KDB21_20280, partial [Acidimicrobiales bacterium]|nr:hypothetical protein [Acidimicrobiales bacterium]